MPVSQLGRIADAPTPITGRVLLFISKNNDTEPRTQSQDDQATCQVRKGSHTPWAGGEKGGLHSVGGGKGV
jgi:hypothetical protein